MGKRLGEMNLDETITAMAELKENLAKVEELRKEVPRLQGEEKTLLASIVSLEKKRANLSSIIGAEEEKMMERVNVKDKEAIEKIAKANNAASKASIMFEEADKNKKEISVLKQQAEAELISAKNLFSAAHKAKETIIEIVKFIEDKLKNI